MSTLAQPMLNTPREQEKAKAGAGRLALLRGLTILTVLGFFFGVYMALAYAGQDAMQGDVQRIFYLHVASFSGASVAFMATVIGGLAYLFTRAVKWDTLALAGVEVGLTMSIVTLATGSVWARPIWNTWWTWDPRLTSAAIMCLTYAAYLMLRNGIENPDKRRTFAAVYGILAISTVIFTFIVIRTRPDTIHPAVIGSSPQEAQGGFKMTETMRATFGFNSALWCCLLAPVLMWWRIRLQNRLEALAARRATLD